MVRRSLRLVRAASTATLTGVLAAAALTSSAPVTSDPTTRLASASAAAAPGNPVTPGNFTGYGFDQCLAPTQGTMDRWLHHSPFLAAGIYISGDSRGCRSQPNLTPSWIRTQLAKGWRLLPITLGPQASCQPSFPRYRDDYRISPDPGSGSRYTKARTMGAKEADKTVGDARRLGISKGSTLWYDLEGFDAGNQHCRESALAFLNAWTRRLHRLDYVSGVYSSAGSGIKMLDDARVNRPRAFTLPDKVWIARWDGVANTSTSYVRNDGWRPGARVKQYRGGHDEVWGGVRINIDSNYLDVGKGSVASPESHCGKVDIDYPRYEAMRPGNRATAPPAKVKVLQCLLKEKADYRGQVNGTYNDATVAAARAWQTARGFTPTQGWSKRDWIALFVQGRHPVQKVGSAGGYVRRVQRAINAADADNQLRVNGVFNGATADAVRRYQREVGVGQNGIANRGTWKKLSDGRR